MRRGWTRPVRPPRAERQATPASQRDRLAKLLALVTIVGLGSAFLLSKGTQVLMPGPLASAHGGMENCSDCHTKSGSDKLSWTHGLVAGDPLADSKACLTCHKMPDTAFNPHSASAEVLKQSTERLTKTAARSPAPLSARAQSIAFPTDVVVARDLYCATCHQEHQGVNFNLNKISNEQCRSCHVVKFDSFDGRHPKFGNYPFKRRTRVIFDHAGHFGKHYPEVAKKEPTRRIPETCSSCHDSREDKRVMTVTPFEKTCSACHLDQIIGKERASGPKGIAFLTLPGLDLQTLKGKDAAVGEWPDASEAPLSPFMKVMISRTARGRALVSTVESLNLQDLSKASDDQIKAVTFLVWEVKALFHALISGKASDVLGDLSVGGGAKLSASLVADLTASIPRDVIISAQQQWLPNLATEMASRKVPGDKDHGDWSAVTTESSLPIVDNTASAKPEGGEETPSAGQSSAAVTDSKSEEESDSPEEQSGSDADQTAPSDSPEGEGGEQARKPKIDPPVCSVSVFGQCLVFKEQKSEPEAPKPEGAVEQTDTADPKPDGDKETSSASELPGRMNAGVKVAQNAVETGAPAKKADAANAKPDGGKETPSANEQSPNKAADQTDDLLFPTEEELRAIKAAQPDGATGKGDTANAKPDGGASADAPSADSESAAAKSPLSGAPVISIESDVDPESWAEYGGWYRQDYAIFYRPAGHKDKFIYSWLFLTGPQAPKGDVSPAAAVFDYLTSKDAQGSCTKCHSVDEIESKGRLVNFSPTSVESKQGRFTHFIHEPHFAILEDRRAGAQENRGCLTCHSLEKTQLEGEAANNDAANAKPDGAASADAPSNANAAGPADAPAKSGAATASRDAEKAAQPETTAGKTDTTNAKPDGAVSAAAAPSKANAAAPADAPADPGAATADKGAEKESSPYLKSYEQSNPHNFVSNFGAVKKGLCETCHTRSMARQDCLLCHKYHVNGVITPITNTKLPIQ